MTVEKIIEIVKNEINNPPNGWPFEENFDKEVGWVLAAKHILKKVEELTNMPTPF